MGAKASKAEGGPLDKKGTIAVAQKSAGDLQSLAVVAEDEIDLPWHAVPDAKDVVEDLASSVHDGLSSGELMLGYGADSVQLATQRCGDRPASEAWGERGGNGARQTSSGGR